MAYEIEIRPDYLLVRWSGKLTGVELGRFIAEIAQIEAMDTMDEALRWLGSKERG